MSQYNICNSLLQNTCNLVLSVGRKALGQDPISGMLLPTDENIGSRMKTNLASQGLLLPHGAEPERR
jgi:hypothetical protein